MGGDKVIAEMIAAIVCGVVIYALLILAFVCYSREEEAHYEEHMRRIGGRR